ncbi:MAG: amidase [SAR202 cluster bacterium]|nr:amidase [Chloroflexota bacterium]MDP6421759.1 amidase [SAR202 cluster bacterium]MDP6665238.1 amidase [SAR202 cluster bacterium]MQG56542.1 amidase [SAR202 cluster bacterium]MQG68673.1 amidase [SAR202 cluster bacterium]|tara:strand:+ start:899 stop:2290 length:1392 start_codon:yes stop_codon:yes gene_type:complete
MDDMIFSSATKIAQAVRDKKVSAVEVVESHLRRIGAVNPKLNAVVQLCAERALSEAADADAGLADGRPTGPLHGVPMTLKDSLDTEGVVTTGGTQGRAGFVPSEDATVTARLRDAGAILLGKTNTPELTLAGETDNLIYGRTENPYKQDRIPGGSSGGAASIIAAGGSPLDMGSDTGGSIRLPAHFCGIAGLKPNSGRVPRTGHIVPYGMGAVDALTQNGPLARFVEDLALTLPIIAGPDWRDPAIVPAPLGDPADVKIDGLRIAMHTDNSLKTPTTEIQEAVRAAARALEDFGAVVEETRPEALEMIPDISPTLNGGDGRAWVTRLLERAGTTEMSPFLKNRFATIDPVSSGEFTAALEDLDLYRSRMLGFMRDYDAILCPAAAIPACEHGGSWLDENQWSFTYCGAYNMTGWPGAVVRGGTSPDGLPIGVQVVTRPWREDVALAVAARLESALGGWEKPEL